MQFKTAIATLALITTSAACQAPTLYVEERATLQAAQESLDSGQFEAVQTPLEQLVAGTSKTQGNYSLQKFFAAFLLVRANLSASLDKPYLTEPATSRGGTSKPSWIAQTVAATYEMDFAEDWAAKAAASPATIDGEALLPESLANYGVPTARRFITLGRLFAAARLGFQQDVAALLQEYPELEDLAACEQSMAETELDEDMKPWILFGVFDYLKTRDEPLAYLFGIRARQLTKQSKSALAAGLGDTIVHWIQFDSSFVFESNRGIPFDPGLSGDPDAGQANIEYLARKKEAD